MKISEWLGTELIDSGTTLAEPYNGQLSSVIYQPSVRPKPGSSSVAIMCGVQGKQLYIRKPMTGEKGGKRLTAWSVLLVSVKL